MTIKKVTYIELEQQIEDLKSQVAIFEQNEASLKQSAKRYRALLDFTPYPIATFTLKGSISYLNPSFTEVFGWTLDEKDKRNSFAHRQPGLCRGCQNRKTTDC